MAPKRAGAARGAGSAPKRAPRKKKAATDGHAAAVEPPPAEVGGEGNVDNVNDMVEEQVTQTVSTKGAKAKAARGKKAKSKAAPSEASDASDDDVVIEDEEDPWRTKEELENLEKQVGAELVVTPEVRESREPPSSLVIPLLSYQKEFLAWAIKQELGPLRGGVLADEMGMGKTLQAVCVIVTHPRDGDILGGNTPASLEASAPSATADTGPAKQLRIAMPLAGAAAPSAAASVNMNQASGSRSGSDPASDTCVPLSSLPDSKHDVDSEECPEKSGTGGAAAAPCGTAKQTSASQGAGAPAGSDVQGQVKAGKGKGKGKAAKKPRVDPLIAAIEQAKHCHAEPESGSGEFCGATLVVCPVVAAMQWRQEILRYTTPGSVKVLLYHGTNRSADYTREQLESADIVLTTYSILEVDFRKNLMAPKATCEFCCRKFQPERLKVHLRYFCGPYAAKTEAQAKQQKKGMPWMRGPGKGKGKGKDGASTSKASTSKAAEQNTDAEDEGGSDDEDLKKPGKHAKEPKNQAKKRSTASTAAAKKKPAAKAGKSAASEPPAAALSAAEAAEDHEPPTKKRAVKGVKAAPAEDAMQRDQEDTQMSTEDQALRSAEVPEQDSVPAEAASRVQRRRLVKKGSAASLQGAAPLTVNSLEDSTDGSGDDGDAKTPRKGPARQPSQGKKAKAARKAAAKKVTGSKRKRVPRAASNSDSDGSDWAPDSEESEGAQDSETESDMLTVSEDESEDEEEEEEEEEETGMGRKGAKQELTELIDDAALDEAVEKAAARMIAAAARERAAQSSDGHSLLHEIRWRRIILDEAHNIKDRRCNTAQSAFALTAAYRWCLSGTPLQNRVTELYSLVRFLRIYPYSHYFADKTKCCSLDFPFKNDLRKCDLCGGSRMSHYCWWNRRIANPIKFNGYEGRGRTAMLILKHQILPRMLLRRTKMQCADDLALPPRRLVLRKDPFDAREADFYEALYTQSQAAFSGYVDSGTILNNYAHIFDLLIRLRQAVNHPYLVVYSASGGRNDNTGSSGDKQMLGICGICHDPLEDGLAAECGHTFCRICVTEYLDNTVGACTCPTCSRPLTIDLDASSAASLARAPSSTTRGSGAAGTQHRFRKTSILSRLDCDAFQTSTKLEALLETIEGMRRDDVSAKCIVFSQFTSMLDLVQFRLQQAGVRCIKLEGSMSLDVRARMIETFNTDPDVTCFLMSLKAGGVALNLTVASHVMLMDPWWNPAVEQQAQDRIHRLGQYKPITVTRFIIAGTIEERILKLQEKKQLVFEGTVGRDSEALGKLTVDDLRFLFG